MTRFKTNRTIVKFANDILVYAAVALTAHAYARKISGRLRDVQAARTFRRALENSEK